MHKINIRLLSFQNGLPVITLIIISTQDFHDFKVHDVHVPCLGTPQLGLGLRGTLWSILSGDKTTGPG